MRILQVAHSFVPYSFAGTEVFAHALSKELAHRHEVTVFFRVNNPRKKEYALTRMESDGITLYALNHTFNQCGSFQEIYDNPRIDALFGGLLDELRPDIVHIHHLLFLSFGIVQEAKHRGIPVVFSLHDYWLFCHRGQLIRDNLECCSVPEYPRCKICLRSQLSIYGSSMRYYNFLRNKVPDFILQTLKNSYIALINSFKIKDTQKDNLLRRRYEYTQKITSGVDLFISPSRFLRDKFVEFGVAAEKIIINPYGIDHANFLHADEQKSAFLRFGYIGVLLPMKGPNVLIEAFKSIKNNNTELLIFGKLQPYAGYEGYGRLLERSAKQDKRIRLMGEFDNKKIGEVFAQFDVLVVPSNWPENSPLVIQEAFIFDTPIIASRIGGIPELIDDGVNGLLFNPCDSEDLRKKMEFVLLNEGCLREFILKAPRVKTIEEQAKEIEALYNNLINRPFIAAGHSS